MKELRNIPRWAMNFSSCVAAVVVTFVIIGLFDVFTGAGTDKVFFDVVATAGFALAAWSIAVKGNPALSRRRDAAPNRKSPLRW